MTQSALAASYEKCADQLAEIEALRSGRLANYPAVEDEDEQVIPRVMGRYPVGHEHGTDTQVYGQLFADLAAQEICGRSGNGSCPRAEAYQLGMVA